MSFAQLVGVFTIGLKRPIQAYVATVALAMSPITKRTSSSQVFMLKFHYVTNDNTMETLKKIVLSLRSAIITIINYALATRRS